MPIYGQLTATETELLSVTNAHGVLGCVLTLFSLYHYYEQQMLNARFTLSRQTKKMLSLRILCNVVASGGYI